nr:MAG TPA: oxidoreductase [Caudoviricetes sp.]
MICSGFSPSAHFSAQMARRIRLLAVWLVLRRWGMGHVSRGSMMFYMPFLVWFACVVLL